MKWLTLMLTKRSGVAVSCHALMQPIINHCFIYIFILHANSYNIPSHLSIHQYHMCFIQYVSILLAVFAQLIIEILYEMEVM